MTWKSLTAVGVMAMALAAPWSAQAETYNDGTFKWGFDTIWNDAGTEVTGVTISSVQRVDGLPIEGALVFPASVTVTVTNELGYSKWDESTEKYTWISTRAQKIETLTFPVEEINLYLGSNGGICMTNGWGGTVSQRKPTITAVVVPEGVKWVEDLVGECLTNVTSVTLPSTLKSIVDSFGYCDKLASVSIPAGADVDSAFIGTAWAKSMGDFFIVGENLVRYQGTATDVVVPDGVTVIGEAAFAPYYWGGFTEESYEMFAAATNITSVTLPESVEEIRASAFEGCVNLTTVNVPKRTYEIEKRAFADCEKLKQIALPRVITLGYRAFAWSGLTAIELPATMRHVGEDAFYYTSIASIAFPEGQKYFHGSCCAMTNLTSVTLPASAQVLNWEFEDCEKLASVTIPDSVYSIGEDAFLNCKSLTSIVGGAGLQFVHYDAFGDWEEQRNRVPVYSNAVDGFRTLGPVAYGFKGEAPENLTVPAGIRFVGSSVMEDAKDTYQTKSVTLSDGVEVVGYCAFSSLYNVGTVNLGTTVTNLGSWAFECSGVSNVTGGVALRSGRSAFGYSEFIWNLDKNAETDEPFAWVKIGSVAYGYRGKFPVGPFDFSGITEYRWCFDSDTSATNVTAVTGGEGLSYVDFDGMVNLQTIDLTAARLTGCYLWGLENLTSVTLGVDEGFDSLGFVYDCDRLSSLALCREGYQLQAYRGYTGGYADETFPSDVSAFQYQGYREGGEPDEEGYVEYETINLYPVWKAVAVDPQSLEAFDSTVKSVYAGLLYDVDGRFAGSFEATVNKAAKGKNSKATVTIVPIGGKKETVKGEVDANGNGLAGLAGLSFGANGVFGNLTSAKTSATFSVAGATDASKAKTGTEADKLLKTFKGKAWGLALGPDDDALASEFANGNAAFSVVMATKGKAKITGVMPNGTKVSLNTKMIVGDEKCAIPVVFSKRTESFGFVFWVDLAGKPLDITDRTDWTGLTPAKAVFVQTWQDDYAMGDPLVAAADPTVYTWVSDLPSALTNVQTEFLPILEPFTVDAGGRWKFAKAPKIAYKKGVFDQASYDKSIAAGKTNNSGLKLTLTKKTGAFKGSYTIYYLDATGKLKKIKPTVNGVMINGIGYGSALIKKMGAVPFMVGHEELAVDQD